MRKTILITGDAGFIGSAVVRHSIGNTNDSIVNVFGIKNFIINDFCLMDWKYKLLLLEAVISNLSKR